MRRMLGIVLLVAGFVAVRGRRREDEALADHAAEQVVIDGTAGRLRGHWMRSVGDGGGRAVLAVHGYASSGEDLLPIAPDFVAAGWSVLAIDLRGHGGSDAGEGRPTPPSLAEDVHAGIDWLLARGDVDDVVLLGHSMGGSTVILTASERVDVAAVVTVGAVADPTLTRIGWWPAFLSRLLLAGVARRHGVEPSRSFAVNRIHAVDAPVLMVHGTGDRIVPVRHLAAFEAAVPRTRTLRIDGAGHTSIDRYREAMPAIMAFLDEVITVRGD